MGRATDGQSTTPHPDPLSLPEDGMTEHALVAACVANRKDNTPRLVYADWLEEFGTTDRQRAVMEWIRLTCAKPRPGERRQAGEGDWLRENFPRLWPTLTALRKPDDVRRFVVYDVRLAENRIDVAVQAKSSTGRQATTWVSIYGERGVVESVYVAFSYANSILAALATDAPTAQIRSGLIEPAHHVYVHGPASPRTSTVVYRRAFEIAKLVDVWDALEGWQATTRWNNGSLGREYHEYAHQDAWVAAHEAFYSALTRAARTRAGVPHVVVATPEPEPPPAEPLVVPPRV